MDIVLTGRVTAAGAPTGLTNARVEGWDISGAAAKALTVGRVKRGGVFSMVVTESVVAALSKRESGLELRVVYQSQIVAVEPLIIWRPGDPAQGLDLRAGVDREGHEFDGTRSVYGRVTLPLRNRPAVGLVVRAYDRDLRDEELLGESVTGPDGQYAIGYSRAAFSRAEKDSADLVVRVFDGGGKTVVHEPRVEDIIYNAGHEVRVDVQLTAEAPAGIDEFQRLVRTLLPLTPRVELTDLTESPEHRDVTFLSRETGEAAVKIEHLIVSHRLGAAIQADPAVFYALLRMETLISSNPLQYPVPRVAIGVNDDTRDVLLQAALVDPKLIRRDVAAAVESSIVSKQTARNLKPVLDTLERLRPEAEENDKTDLPDSLLGIAERLAEQTEQVARLVDLLNRKGDFTAFLDELVTDWFGDDQDGGKRGDKDRRGDDDGRAPERRSHLADAIGPRAAEARDRRRARKAETLHPSAAVRTRVKRGTLPVRDPGATAKILGQHKDLELGTANLDRFFVDQHLDSPKDREVLTDLKRVQRMLRLAPDLDRVEGLLGERMYSAADVVATGKTRFLTAIAPAAGLSETEAVATFHRAEAAQAAALVLAGEIQSVTSVTATAASPGGLTVRAAALGDSFPNLTTLFGSNDQFTCAHCRSVFSPAAYLVELLEFLGRRDMVDLTQTPPVKVNLAKDILLERRGEIADLDLNCENAETPFPYIDLVCEILEEEIAPDPGIAYNGPAAPGLIPAALLAAVQGAGWRFTDAALIQPADINGDLIIRDEKETAKLQNQGGQAWLARRMRQTHGSAVELNAAPEYLNTGAYAALAGANYAFTLPFDLNHVEAHEYFDRFGITRTQLMRNFAAAGGSSDETIAAEGLGLTDAGRVLVVTPNTGGQDIIWALPAATVVSDMSVVATMLDKTGLTYEALDRLLQLGLIDPANQLFIRHLDLTADLTQKVVEGLDAPALDRIHRFLRLQQATGWADTVLDAALMNPALGGGTLDDAAIIAVEHLRRLADRTGIKPAELTACFGEIPHTQMTGTGELPIYHTIFLNRAALGRIEPGLLPERIDAGGTIAPLAAPLAALLKLTADDFERLRASLTDDQLTFTNLSQLYGAARLIDRLKLTGVDFLTLVARTGVDPFTSAERMLAFIDHVDLARSGPVRISDLPFMLEHSGEVLPLREITDERVTDLLSALQTVYQAAYAETRSAFDPALTVVEQRTPLKDALLRLPGATEEAANTVLRMYDAAWTSPPDPDAGATLAELLGGHFDTTTVAAAQAAVAAAPTGPGLETAQLVLADTLLGEISQYLHGLAKQGALVEALSAFSRQGLDLVATVVHRAALRQPAPGAPRISDLLSDDSLIDTVNDPPVSPALNPAAFPEQFRAVRLLHKLLPLAEATGLTVDDLDWLMTHAVDLGWPALDGIPYEAAQVTVAHSDWELLSRVLALFEAFPPVSDPADPALPITFTATLARLLPGNLTGRTEWLDAVALLTGEDRQDLDDLDTRFGWSAVDLDAWRRPETWETMGRCLADLRTISATVAVAESYIQPVLSATETAALRVALKARYADAIWLTTLAEITNAVRGRKRDALVAFLLAERDEWATPTDLYDHFLIDVEMESKVASSRIVQAHGTIQLFVERSRMGLETRASADTTDTGWDQWTWMRNYRVWEANRKIFVTPENWIEPELLDDKSQLFQSLEDELLQNEVNEFTTEDGFIRYLEGLDGISFLEVIATFYQSDIRTMHVFARTKGGDPAQYYHRRFVRERYWTPWVVVDLDITSDSLLAFVRNSRLHLAWPVISEETNPNQDVTTPGVSESPSVEGMQHPELRLRIQLAVSEFANKTWKPRKISQDAVLTPAGFTTDQSELDHKRFNLLYNAFSDDIWVFHTTATNDWEGHTLDGVFNVAGCKGYPEVLPTRFTYLPDFFPDYKDSLLQRQRYFELGHDTANSLAIRNMLTPAGFVVRLNATPGWFRITHPHQFTVIDLIYVLLQVWVAYARNTSVSVVDRFLKVPFGSWLPYFFEDSSRAYVIVPGLYQRESGGDTQRTVSDFLQLIDDVVALILKYVAKLTASPAPILQDVVEELAVDPDFLHVRDEFEVYGTLRFGEQFRNLYHPLICHLRTVLYQHGVGAMMARDEQLTTTPFNFDASFDPNEAVVAEPYPIEDIDFTSEGSYSLYNWELFFHSPLMIAKRLASEQRFEEAMVWYHRIFNPTGTLEGTTPQKYWVTKPFFLATDADYVAQRIDTLLTNIADPSSPVRHELEFAIDEWRINPFRPHVVARFRTVAYQRNVVMSYVRTLIEWGDYLFRQDTMESITQATQLYILADKLLGPKPRTVPAPVEVSAQTYSQLVGDLDEFGNALVELENYLPDLSVLPEGGAELPPPPVTLASLYFCIPPNELMLAQWTTVADRLFKIRNSQNIDGVERILALFAPPIDPGMLVRAAAAGLDLSSILAGMNAPVPAYRFQVLARKATELAEEVRQLGNALLSALEKKDAEVLALLRNDLEIKLLTAQSDLKEKEIESAIEQIEVINRTRDVTEERHAFYSAFERINQNEQLNLDKLGEATDFQTAAGIVRATGAVLGIIPDFTFGAHGAGGSPAIHATFGGSTLAQVADAAATVLNIFSGIASYEATRAGALAGFDRRADDAHFQERMAIKELAQIDQQLDAAEIRRDIAAKDLEVHTLQIENAEKISHAMEDKYTNTELYQWMVNDITSVYYRAYQLSYDTAKMAERCYQHELGVSDTFLAFGYWDSRKKGLQSANKLLHDIKRMETKYLQSNRREYELTKHVSLRQLDPLALVRFTSTGVCDFEIPEALYDMDHPGHYLRRIRTVAVSLPSVAGPYTSVSARLTQVSNRYRKTTATAAGAGTPTEEYEESPGNDTRFVYDVGASQSVATSSGQNDAGLFQLDFRDDRYLPFENTGAIGAWRLELPGEVRQFDYSTISDVILHVRYTAREGGSSLRTLAAGTLLEKLQEIRQDLSRTGLHVMLDLKREYFNAWHELKSTGATNLTIEDARLPYFVQPLAPVLGAVTVLAKATGDPAALTLGVDGVDVPLNFSADWGLNLNDVTGPALGTPIALTLDPSDLAGLEELRLILKLDFV